MGTVAIFTERSKSTRSEFNGLVLISVGSGSGGGYLHVCQKHHQMMMNLVPLAYGEVHRSRLRKIQEDMA